MRRDVVATIAARIVIMIASLAGAVVTARYLGPTGRGEFFFMVTLAAAATQVGNLGLHASNTYSVAQDERLLGPLFANSLWISLVVGTAIGAVVVGTLAATAAFPDTSTLELVLAASLVPPSLFFMLGTNLLVGVQRITLFNGFEVGSRLAVIALLVAAALLGFGAQGLVAATVVAWSLAGAVLAWTLWRRGRGTLRFSLRLFQAGLRYAARAYVVAMLSFLVLRANVFVVQRAAGERELGYFSIATQVADVLAILPASVGLVLFPALVRVPQGSFAAATRATLAVGAVLTVASVAAGIVAEPAIALLFGPTFEPAAAILWWMLPGVVALGMTSVLSQYLAALGIPLALLATWAAGLAGTVALGAALVPSYGGRGGAAALSATYLVVLGVVTLLARRASART